MQRILARYLHAQPQGISAMNLEDKTLQLGDAIGGIQALSNQSNALEDLLIYLRQSHGFDFNGYKRPSLTRRLQQRMQMVRMSNYSNYRDYLQENPKEFNELFNKIEINFTSFFRDAETWDYLVTEIVPRIIASKQASEPIRVWSAGCASGEETYTLAIVLAQALGVEQFHKRVQIYASDVDEEALSQARQGTYLSAQVVKIPHSLLFQYFEQVDGHYVVCKDLRRSITFCRHDLIQDAPMSKIDLLVCRNVVIYFNIEAQIRALMRFHFSLKDSGFLFYGKAEMLPTNINLFTAVDHRQHVFTKVPGAHLDRHLLPRAFLRQERGR